MFRRPTRLAVIGAGMSGSILSDKLCRHCPNIEVHLIGPEDSREQRISGWFNAQQIQEYRLRDANRWQHWTLKHQGISANQKGDLLSYVSFDAKRYKTKCLKRADEHGLVRQLCFVENIDFFAGEYSVKHNQGNMLFDIVIDTRAPSIPSSTLKQQFYGQTFLFHTKHGIDCPILMDFDVIASGNRGIEFIYALPLDPYRLLVEATAFSLDHYSEDYFKQVIHDWLYQHKLVSLCVESTERGCLPMGDIEPPYNASIHCGLSANAARPSTGYAFTGIQRQTTQLTSQLLTGKALKTTNPYSMTSRWMDKVFLNVITRQPKIGVELFMAMSAKLTGDEFGLFLSDQGGIAPRIKTILAAPKRPFIHGALMG